MKRLSSKIYPNTEDAARQIKKWQAAGERVIFTNGCFDLLHPGHTDYLQKAKSLGRRLVVALNTDESVSRLKGPHRPIQLLPARELLMAALECVDMVCRFEEDTPLRIIRELSPDMLVKGADYQVENVVGAREVMAGGGSVALLPYLPGYSTSAIEQRILAHYRP